MAITMSFSAYSVDLLLRQARARAPERLVESIGVLTLPLTKLVSGMAGRKLMMNTYNKQLQICKTHHNHFTAFLTATFPLIEFDTLVSPR
jgi:hypothetical protein